MEHKSARPVTLLVPAANKAWVRPKIRPSIAPGPGFHPEAARLRRRRRSCGVWWTPVQSAPDSGSGRFSRGNNSSVKYRVAVLGPPVSGDSSLGTLASCSRRRRNVSAMERWRSSPGCPGGTLWNGCPATSASQWQIAPGPLRRFRLAAGSALCPCSLPPEVQ